MRRIFSILFPLALGCIVSMALTSRFQSRAEEPSRAKTTRAEKADAGVSADAEPAASVDRQTEYLKSLKRHPVTADHVQPPRAVRDGTATLAREKQLEIESRRQLVAELNDGRNPDLTLEERELVARMLREEGMSSIHESP